MTSGRDRSLLAVVEIGAAALLIGSLFLPWFEITYLRDPSVTYLTGPTTASFSWVAESSDSNWARSLGDQLIPYGAIAAVAAGLLGLALPGRGKVLAILFAFIAAGVGATTLLTEINSGFIYPRGIFMATEPGFGLWLFAGIAASGAIVAMIDVALAGSSTFASRALAKLAGPDRRRAAP